MLYRRIKRRPVRPNRRLSPLTRGQRVILYVVIVVLFLFITVSIVLAQLRPMMLKLAKTMVTDVVLIQANDVIEEEVLNGSFDYNKLVTLEKDEKGNITALITNMAMINTLQTRISRGVFERVDDQVLTDLEIPLGNAIGGVIFSGHGPTFKVKILSIADVDTDIENSFTSAGINQTRHTIYMNISTSIDIVVPGYASDTITVSTRVAVAETVIVGIVPNVYADIGESGGLK